MKDRKPSLGSIFLTIFMDLLGFGLVLPFLAEEARSSFHTTAFVGSLLSSIYSLMQFLFVPVWGRLSDSVGRRPVMIWSVAGSSLGMLALGLALGFGDSLIWLFLARFFSGAATANIGTASAYIADITKPEDRSRGMALIGMAFGLGFIIGPALGGILASYTFNGRHGVWPCFLSAALSAINFCWVLWGLPESLPPENRNTKIRSRSLWPLNIKGMRETLSNEAIAIVVALNFVIILSFTMIDQTFRSFNKDMFGMVEIETGIAFVLIGVCSALTQGSIRVLAKYMQDATLIRLGLFIQAFGFFGLAASPSLGRAILYLSAALLAVGNGLSQPSVSGYISKRTGHRSQGQALSTSQSFSSLARVFGPALGGLLFSHSGPRTPYVSSAIGMILALLFSAKLETGKLETGK